LDGPLGFFEFFKIKKNFFKDDMRNFCWEKYIKQCQGSAAPDDLFVRGNFGGFFNF